MFNKRKLKRMIFVLIPAYLVGAFMLQADKISASSEEQYSIQINPSEFNVKNMRPGYVEDYTLTITNTGNEQVKYNVKSKMNAGEALYNQLKLTVKQNNKELYNGKLSNLTINPRNLIPHEHEDLTFSIGLNEGAGNEFQGLAASFKFQIQGEGQDPDDDGGGGDPPGDDGGTPGDGGGNTPGDNDGTPGDNNGNNPPGQNPPPKDNSQAPGKSTGSLPQTGEESPLFMIMSGLFISLAGLGLLLVKKSIIPNPFKKG
ncbi:LPXTG cell wall anchor domain-containing protein [Fictibacillus barbaricus]|uniref:LPXTG-motif cell wall-anchored protein n=1 Tax=Fictibacillus barbaricus TaxID=182136 RepID=A0ABU1U1G7_9BACL|nr:LPXTG cell wall anchor domain-containing protein [Fictibacillus barbaricus]MDR7073337.1 LPXTG-motif cell wall-anchored protein [Fictibacillus barbaricus]